MKIVYESDCQKLDKNTMDLLDSQDHMRNPLNTRCANEAAIIEAEVQRHKVTGAETTALDSDRIYEHYEPSVRLLRIRKTITGSCGFNLTRTKWDPYPWVNAVDAHTAAEMSGLRAGDCVLEVNGEDVLGLRIKDIAKLVQAKSGHVTLLLWSCGSDFKCDPKSICCAPMPRTLQRLATIVQSILTIIECPVCLDTIAPPVMQCQNGHLLCLNCRIRAEKCPICRDRYTPQRALIAEQIYETITNAYNLCSSNEDKLRQKLFGGGGETKSGMSVKSRRWRRAEAAKQTIESDQQTEAGVERLQAKKRWRSHKQIKEDQCHRQCVASDGAQSGRFSFMKDAEAFEVGEKISSATDVTDVNAAKHEKKRKKILMKLWNGKAESMESVSTSSVTKIKPFRSGQQNSEVIDTRSNGKDEQKPTHGLTTQMIESQITTAFPTHTLQLFSNRFDSNLSSSKMGRVEKNVQNDSTLNENNSDSTRNTEDTEEVITAATSTITNTPMTMQMQTNKTILNAAATNNGTYVNDMSKLLSSSATTSTKNDSPASRPSHLPPPPQHQQQQQACKNNGPVAETVKQDGKIISQRQQHVQPQRQLCTWQQQQHKICDSVSTLTKSSSTTTIAAELCMSLQHSQRCPRLCQNFSNGFNRSFENCSYYSSFTLPHIAKRRSVVHTRSRSTEYLNKYCLPDSETSSLPPADLKKYCNSNATSDSSSGRKCSSYSKSNSNGNNNSSCCSILVASSYFVLPTPDSSISSGNFSSSMDPKDLVVTIQQCGKQHKRTEITAITTNKNALLSPLNSLGQSSFTTSSLHSLSSLTSSSLLSASEGDVLPPNTKTSL